MNPLRRTLPVLCLSLFAACTLSANEYYVDNVKGDDANDGVEAAPFRTIQKALKLVNPGDTIFLTKNDEPYREEKVVLNKSGEAGMPITLDGRGAVLSGLQQYPSSVWTDLGNGVYSTKFSNATPKASNWKGPFSFVFFDKQPGKNAPSKAELQPNGFYLSVDPADVKSNLFISLPPGKTPENTVILMPRQDHTGVHVQANYVTVKNMTSAYTSEDGFATTDGHDITFENVRGCYNLDQGMSHHGAQVVTKNSVFDHNGGAGVRDVWPKCESIYEGCAFVGNSPAGADVRGKQHRFTNCYFLGNKGIQIQVENNVTADVDGCYFDAAGTVGVHAWKNKVSVKTSTFRGMNPGVNVLDASVSIAQCAFVDCRLNLQLLMTDGLDAAVSAGQIISDNNLFAGGAFRLSNGGPEVSALSYREKTGLDASSVVVESLSDSDLAAAPVTVEGKSFGSSLSPTVPEQFSNLTNPDPIVSAQE